MNFQNRFQNRHSKSTVFSGFKNCKKVEKTEKVPKSVGFGQSRKMSVLAQKNVDFVPSLDWGNGDIPSA